MKSSKTIAILVCMVVAGWAWQPILAQSGTGHGGEVPAPTSQAPAQASGQAGAAAGKVTCPVSKAPPSDAEKALAREQYDQALDLYRTMSTSAPDESRAGVIRTLIEQDKVREAEDSAKVWMESSQGSAAAKEAMGEVLYRKGQLPAAVALEAEAIKANRCLARAYAVSASVQNMAANYATGKRLIDTAEQLAPTDISIRRAWIATLPRERRLQEEAALLKDGVLSGKRSERMAEYLRHAGDYKAGDCQLATPVEQAEFPIQSIMNGPQRLEGLALDVYFNGKRRRLEIDTGASGILLMREAASGLGLAHDQVLKMNGLGDKGEVGGAVAHVESIRVGAMEFRNCPIRMLDKAGPMDLDGLIGADFFAKYVVSLDFRTLKMDLKPLPKRPEGTEVVTASENDEEKPRVLHDRYIAPEMKDWTKVWRIGHEMLLPVSIGKSSEKLFLIDTGARLMAISPEAAREVTKVDGGSPIHVKGISGEVNTVYETRDFELRFARLMLPVNGMISFDTTKQSHDAGVEISGFMGAPVLNRLALHIDYRDDLVKFDYDPKNDPINYARPGK